LTVLVVEDEPEALRLMAGLLARQGYAVLTAENGVAALEQVRAHRPSIVVADWMMPGMDGLALCRLVRADPDAGVVYFVMLTALSDRRHRLDALDAGADEFLTKPFDVEELLARLRTAVRIVGAERQMAERLALRAERDHLKQALAATDQVLGVVGHELRTPLAALRAITEFLLTDAARGTAEWDVFLRNAHDEVVRMAGRVDQLLEAARVNSGRARWNWGTFSPFETCDQALDEVRPLLDNAAVRLELAAAPDAANDEPMRGDADAFRRLVVNLAANAVRHTPAGEVRVEVRRWADAAGDWAEVRVLDTGTGIDPALGPRLGVAFALNSGLIGAHNVRGTGLGLSICRGIVAAHGGWLDLAPRPGGGTVATARLRADLASPVEATHGAALIESDF
jgi:signal transduction histidine kinase